MKEIEYFKGVKVGIVGYGKLGQALESRIYAREDMCLVAIFSKREGLVSPYGTLLAKTDDLPSFENRIDYLFLCGGSFSDMEELSIKCARIFNTIDCYDNHAKMSEYISSLGKVNKESKTTSLVACGWDPGLFSMMRCLLSSISEGDATTFWGKGISQGHSNALRQIGGVKDALSYTIPVARAIKQCKDGEYVPDKQKHKRVCYVHKEHSASKRALREIICHVPDYFEGYDVRVHFVSQTRLNKMKQKLFHRGEVFKSFSIKENHFDMNFSLNLDSNPLFTAECLLIGLNALKSLARAKKYGTFTLFDIPLKYLSPLPKPNLVSKYI